MSDIAEILNMGLEIGKTVSLVLTAWNVGVYSGIHLSFLRGATPDIIEKLYEEKIPENLHKLFHYATLPARYFAYEQYNNKNI
jgi:hypothetical protein